MEPLASLYFDYQASTPLDPEVRAMMTSVSDASWANPHADDHQVGWAARKIIDRAREQIAEALGALPQEVIFTSGATEADNLGVLGAAFGAPPERRRILVSAIEHKAVLECAHATQAFGFQVDILPVGADGIIDLDVLASRLSNDVAVVSVMTVNNEIGVIQPIKAVAALASRAGAFVHTDATQAPLAMAIDVLDWGVDAASFSSHKVYGPKGVGALYLSSTPPWRPKPLMFGGGQEQGLRPGTLPTELCAGFGHAMSLLNEAERRSVSSLRDWFAEMLQSRLGDVRVTSGLVGRHPGNLHVRIPGIDAKDLITRCQPRLAASTGSACTSGLMSNSHVLAALGFSDVESSECLRFSMGRFTTAADVVAAVNVLEAGLLGMSSVQGD